jgi:hypothetical protein
MSINTSVHRVTSIKLGSIDSEKDVKWRDLKITTDAGVFRLTMFADDAENLRVQLEEPRGV